MSMSGIACRTVEDSTLYALHVSAMVAIGQFTNTALQQYYCNKVILQLMVYTYNTLFHYVLQTITRELHT